MTTIRTGGVAAIARTARGITPHENLVIKYVTAATIDIDADALLLFDSNGVAKRVTSVNHTADITASGANGLDTGSEATSTWYHVWEIYNPTTDTAASLLSLSATSPTLPSGYTYSGRIGAIYNLSSGDIRPFLQFANRVTVRQNSSDGNLAITNGTATSWTSVDASVIVPTTAKRILVSMGIETTSGTAQITANLSSVGSGSGAADIDQQWIAAVVDTTPSYFSAVSVPMQTAQTFYYRLSGANPQVQGYISGWEF